MSMAALIERGWWDEKLARIESQRDHGVIQTKNIQAGRFPVNIDRLDHGVQVRRNKNIIKSSTGEVALVLAEAGIATRSRVAKTKWVNEERLAGNQSEKRRFGVGGRGCRRPVPVNRGAF
jgi:hypothetical protein